MSTLEEFMAGNKHRDHGHGGASCSGLKTVRKMEELPLDERMKAADVIVTAAQNLQKKLIGMGMTKVAAGSMALDLVGTRGAHPRDFEDYEEGRDYGHGH